MVAEKEKALETAILHIEKEFGKGAIMRLGEATRNREALDARGIHLEDQREA